MAFSQSSSFLLQFLAAVVLARYLSPYEMGIYTLAAAIIGVLSLMQALGLQSLLVRETHLTPEIIATAFTVNAILALILSSVIVTASLLGSSLGTNPGVSKVLLILALNPLIGIFEFRPSANLERAARFRQLALAGTMSSLVLAVLSISLAMLGFGYTSIAYASWGGAAISAILLNAFTWGEHRSYFGFTAWRHVARFGVQMFAVTGIHAIAQRFSDVLMGRLQGLTNLGLYSRAVAANGLLWSVHLVTARVVFVEFAQLNRQGVSLKHRYLQTLEIMTTALWPAFAGCAILAGPFIRIAYGEKWVAAAVPLSLLAIASAIQVAITMTWELFAAKGEVAIQTRIEFIRALFAIITFAIGCYYSMTAAALARVCDAIFAILLYRRHIERMTDSRFQDFGRIYARSLALTVLAIAPAALLMLLYHFSTEVPIAMMGGSVLAGVALWCAGLLVSHHPLVDEGRLLLRRLRSARN